MPGRSNRGSNRNFRRHDNYHSIRPFFEPALTNCYDDFCDDQSWLHWKCIMDGECDAYQELIRLQEMPKREIIVAPPMPQSPSVVVNGTKTTSLPFIPTINGGDPNSKMTLYQVVIFILLAMIVGAIGYKVLSK